MQLRDIHTSFAAGLAALALLAGGSARADFNNYIYYEGHADIGVEYHDGELDLHWHFDGARINDMEEFEGELEPGEVTAWVPESTLTASNANAKLFTGTTDPVYVLPQSAAASIGLPRPGFAGELGTGWSDIQFTILNVVMPEGANMAVWYEAGSELGKFIQTYDGGAGNEAVDSFTIPRRGHEHAFWAFTLPGEYLLTIQVGASHSSLTGGEMIYDEGTIRFFVVPEPASIASLAIGAMGLGLVTLRRRRARA